MITQAQASDLFRSEPERYIDTDVGQVAHRTVGEGPDVLFVHGWPVHGATFRRLLPYLAPHVTCHLIDLPGTGSSRFSDPSRLSVETHIDAVRATVDELGLDSVALVGHDSGGLIARHAMGTDPRLRGLGLIDTEQSQGLHWRFKLFLSMRHAPGFGRILAWTCGQPRVRRNKLLFGDAFYDASLLDGEFDEFFLQPLNSDRSLLAAGIAILKSFDIAKHVEPLGELHRTIEAPTRLVWGAEDRFFPVEWAREMASEFPNGSIDVVADAGLFSHEEKPEEVAAALLPVLAG